MSRSNKWVKLSADDCEEKGEKIYVKKFFKAEELRIQVTPTEGWPPSDANLDHNIRKIFASQRDNTEMYFNFLISEMTSIYNIVLFTIQVVEVDLSRSSITTYLNCRLLSTVYYRVFN